MSELAVTAEMPAPAVNESQTLWERAADTRWGQYLTEIERAAILRAHRECTAPGIGLEVGCEGGRWCRLLTSLGWQMTGTDVNPETLDQCRKRSPGVRCILVAPTDDTFPVDTASVDLLLVMECPVVEAPWFSAEARRVLKPGGILVGNLLNRSSWRGLAANLKSDLLRRPRYYSTSYRTLRKSLVAAGFTFREERGYGWPPFGRMSNSAWIPTAAACERRLGLSRLLNRSPWITFVATLGD